MYNAHCKVNASQKGMQQQQQIDIRHLRSGGHTLGGQRSPQAKVNRPYMERRNTF